MSWISGGEDDASRFVMVNLIFTSYWFKLLFYNSANGALWPGGQIGKAKAVHVGFDHPPALAKSETTAEATMVHYRRVRDEIRAFVESLPESLRK